MGMEEQFSKMEAIIKAFGKMIKNVDGVHHLEWIKRQDRISKKLEFGMKMVN